MRIDNFLLNYYNSLTIFDHVFDRIDFVLFKFNWKFIEIYWILLVFIDQLTTSDWHSDHISGEPQIYSKKAWFDSSSLSLGSIYIDQYNFSMKFNDIFNFRFQDQWKSMKNKLWQYFDPFSCTLEHLTLCILLVPEKINSVAW